jgi:hypothetical protein
MVTDAGKQVFAKANETCAKLGRTMMPLGVPPEEAGIDFGKQFKFECLLAHEIVPSGQGTYTIHVPTEKMLGPVDRVSPPPTYPIKVPVTQLPDIGTASAQTEQLARTYCAKTHKTMVVTGGGFDMGPGLTLISSGVLAGLTGSMPQREWPRLRRVPPCRGEWPEPAKKRTLSYSRYRGQRSQRDHRMVMWDWNRGKHRALRSSHHER